jgi:hypothetical protein
VIAVVQDFTGGPSRKQQCSETILLMIGQIGVEDGKFRSSLLLLRDDVGKVRLQHQLARVNFLSTRTVRRTHDALAVAGLRVLDLTDPDLYPELGTSYDEVGSAVPSRFILNARKKL